MEPNRKYRIPEFIFRDSDLSRDLDENDMSEIERILDVSEAFTYADSRTEKNWKVFSESLKVPMQVSKRPARFAMFRWAAAAIVILTLGLGFWQYKESQNPGYTALYTATDKVVEQKLPDGTSLFLNAGTQLEVKAMNAHKRVLELKTGEVFLRVTHNETPFRVITNRGIVTVMGTEFSIRSGSDYFALYLKTGSIQFESGNKQITMLAGDYLQETSKGVFTLSKVKDNRSYAWVSGKLSFENTSLSEVVKGLETLYKVDFEFDSKLSDDKITISFEDLSAEQAAALLSKTINSKVSVRD